MQFSDTNLTFYMTGLHKKKVLQIIFVFQEQYLCFLGPLIAVMESPKKGAMNRADCHFLSFSQ